MINIAELKSQLEYTENALNVSNKKLEHANERIVEFEDIKKAHLKILNLKDEIIKTLEGKELFKELADNCQASIAEKDISDEQIKYRKDLYNRACVAQQIIKELREKKHRKEKNKWKEVSSLRKWA